MLYQQESRNEAGEYSGSITAQSNQRNYFNCNAALRLSEEQITAIVRILFYIYKNIN